ncbi:hypothetical protein D3C72_767090 [compost metagenome]
MPQRFTLLAQARGGLAQNQRQHRQGSGVQQRRQDGRSFKQRCQYCNDADGAGQPQRQAVTLGEQHAQQQRDRQRRIQSADMAEQAQLQGQHYRQAVARDGLAGLAQAQPGGWQYRGGNGAGGGQRHTAHGQHQADRCEHHAAQQQATIAPLCQLLQIRDTALVGRAGGRNGHRQLLDQRTAAAMQRAARISATTAGSGNSGNAAQAATRRTDTVTTSCG